MNFNLDCWLLIFEIKCTFNGFKLIDFRYYHFYNEQLWIKLVLFESRVQTPVYLETRIKTVSWVTILTQNIEACACTEKTWAFCALHTRCECIVGFGHAPSELNSQIWAEFYNSIFSIKRKQNVRLLSISSFFFFCCKHISRKYT